MIIINSRNSESGDISLRIVLAGEHKEVEAIMVEEEHHPRYLAQVAVASLILHNYAME